MAGGKNPNRQSGHVLSSAFGSTTGKIDIFIRSHLLPGFDMNPDATTVLVARGVE